MTTTLLLHKLAAMLEQVVGCKSLVLVTRKERLRDESAVPSTSAHRNQTVYRFRLLGCKLDRSGRCTALAVVAHCTLHHAHLGRSCRCLILVNRFVEQAQEFSLIRVNLLQKCRILLAKLLEHRLQNRGIRLHHSPQRLELSALAKVVQATSTAALCGAASREHVKGCVRRTATSSRLSSLLLSRRGCRASGCWRRRARGWRGGRGLRLSRLRNTRHEVLDRPVRVVERRSQCRHHLFALETHLHDVRDG
mmetsp:Transcript_13467/g.30861  ORF Transcript_13467/g.30861 Transcript_13467/m.30861 type:complete len:250 (-) Transcript_13467:534-1283(-)